MGVLGPSLNRRSGLFLRNGILLYKQLPWWTTPAPCGGSLPTPMSGDCRYYSPSVFASLPVHPGTLVAGRFTRICEFHSLPNTLEPELRIFYSNFANCGEPLSSATLLMLRWPWSFDVQAKGHRGQQASCSHHKTNHGQHFSARNHWYTLTEVFPWYILRCKVNAKTGHRLHSPIPWDIASSPVCLLTVACFRLVIAPVWAQNPDSHPPKIYTPNKVLYAANHEVNRTYTA